MNKNVPYVIGGLLGIFIGWKIYQHFHSAPVNVQVDMPTASEIKMQRTV